MRYGTICDIKLSDKAFKKHNDEHVLKRMNEAFVNNINNIQAGNYHQAFESTSSKGDVSVESTVQEKDQSNSAEDFALEVDMVDEQEEAVGDEETEEMLTDNYEDFEVNEIEEVNNHLEEHLLNVDSPLKVDLSNKKKLLADDEKQNIELKMLMRQYKVSNVGQENLVKIFNDGVKSRGCSK